MSNAELKAVAFDFLGVIANPRMAFDGDAPYYFVMDEAVADAVTRVRAAGLKTALLSNNDRVALIESPLGSRIVSMFDVLVFASDVDHAKPHPDMFHRVLAELNVEAGACAFIDDSARNCDAAADLGMATHVAVGTTDIVSFAESTYANRSSANSFLPRRSTT